MEYGPVKLMEVLGNICLRCSSLDPKKRLYLDWITIILKESIHYLNNVFE
jgi:hypothetical protein